MRKMSSRHSSGPSDRVTLYAEQVLEGKIPASESIKKACRRHMNDLKTADSRGFYFDQDAADHAIDFFRFLKHSKGEWSGCTFELELWQCFIVGSIFGWKRKRSEERRVGKECGASWRR